MKRCIWILLCCLLTFTLTACNEPTPSSVPEESGEPSFVAVVTEVNGSSLTVEPLEDEDERRSASLITLSTYELDAPFLRDGDAVRITYNGEIMESFPAQIRASAVEKLTDMRTVDFPLTWIDKQDPTVESDGTETSDYVITHAYADCFFAEYVVPMPYVIKVNMPLPEEFCIGDQVQISLDNVLRDEDTHRIEGDLVAIQISTFEMDDFVCYKPVIYLYPEEETDITVTLDLKGKLTCTYPTYQSGWTVTAAPDGTLTDGNGQTYSYLYWEGETDAAWDMSRGFCIKGEDTAAFLETALSDLGLTRREANEFIVYWLPLMQQNPYNLISFQTDVYEDAAALTVTPTPDTVIRVFMVFTPCDTPVDMVPQTLSAPARRGFTVVEWGGTHGQ